jgi:hypothetical protein
MKQSCADQPPGTLPTIRQKQLHKSRQGTMCPGCGERKLRGDPFCMACFAVLPKTLVDDVDVPIAIGGGLVMHLVLTKLFDAHRVFLPESWPPVIGVN